MTTGMNKIRRGLHLAHCFLTTLPLPHVGEISSGEFAYASGYYPAVGWSIGTVLLLSTWLTSFFPHNVAAALTLAIWLTITGMLHFDGLVDSADALLVAKPATQRLEILKDVHVGAFALAVGTLHLITKWSALTTQPNWLVILCAPVLARAAVLLPMNIFPAANQESLGARAREGNWPVATLIVAPAVLLSPHLAIVAVVAALLVASFSARRLAGGISGDIYGAIIELTELAVLLASLWGKS